MAGYYLPEIMLLQVCPCQSSASVTAGFQTKGGSGPTQSLMASNTGMAWPPGPLHPSSPFQGHHIIATRVFYPDCTPRHLLVRWRLQWELGKNICMSDNSTLCGSALRVGTGGVEGRTLQR